MPEYKPYQEREPDTQYQNILRKIMEEGEEVTPIQGEKARTIVGTQLRYKIENGFPLITERDMSGPLLNGALAEHIAFLNGARTQEELEAYGNKWWSRWVTAEKCAVFGLEPGDLGPGSYGAAWTEFPTAEGEPFDQITNVVRQIQERPYLRTHLISPWIPQYTIQHSGRDRKVVVAPCHGWIHVLTNPEQNTFKVHHFQRSGDMPVGVAFNMVQYAAFGLMLEKMTGMTFDEIIFTTSDAHIYESQYEKVHELISREPRPLGTLVLAKTLDNIKDYRPDDFALTDYRPHPKMSLPTPV